MPHAPHTLTGQHRALGSGISKVQSLKLDTSVWSNEIVQVRSLKREKIGVGRGTKGEHSKKALGPAWGQDWNVWGFQFLSLTSASCHPAVVYCLGK